MRVDEGLNGNVKAQKPLLKLLSGSGLNLRGPMGKQADKILKRLGWPHLGGHIF